MNTKQRVKLVGATAMFLCSMSLQAAGLSAPVRPCCAEKVNPTKNEATVDMRKRKQRSPLKQFEA